MSSSSPTRVVLRWAGRDLVFEGGLDEGPPITVDGDAREGPPPMALLLLSLAGCMAVDVRMILEKSRVPVDALEVDVDGWRAEAHPRRYRRIRLTYRVSGPGEEDQAKLDRAVALSSEKYCSVLHSLRSDIDLGVRVVRVY